MKSVKPLKPLKPLKKDDWVDIIAPGSGCDLKTLNKSVHALESLGYHARLSPKLLSKKSPFFSQSDEFRARDFVRAVTAKDSSFVWCLRGGYGALRILPFIDKLKKAKPKIFLGYSDITSLHLFLQQKWGWPVFHGPLFDRLGSGLLMQRDEEELWNVLLGRQQEVVFEGLKPLNLVARNKKSIRGAVTGGNLIVIQSSIGTPWQLDLTDKILFIEEIGERGYRIDRMLVQMKQAGVFKKCRAIVLGAIIGGNESDGKNFVRHAIVDFASNIQIPVFDGMKTGHGDIQRVVPFGTQANLNITDSRLVIPTGIAHE